MLQNNETESSPIASYPGPMEPNEIPNAAQTPTLTVPEAGRFIGLGRAASYEAARRGQLPTLRFGKRLLVPTAEFRRLLGLETP